MEYGLRRELKTASVTKTGLNPCCNGIWSQTLHRIHLAKLLVLILVVMEYGLRHAWRNAKLKNRVLILVVMEYGLRLSKIKLKRITMTSLNPCCNGIWSQTFVQQLSSRIY